MVLTAARAQASGHLDFTLHKLGPGKERALLVVAGIQGDEPGGFNAANILVSRYRITKGSVWVVPNLNLLSIVRNGRGVHGDMNRKFAALKDADPDFETVRRIKAVIQDPRVALVLNMHDGSGYYRPTYLDPMRNPLRWGQSVIIDQDAIEDSPYGRLEDVAQAVCSQVNRSLYDPEHALHVKNTNTRLGDVEMEKTLTYFAINRAKAAFGLEASKNFNTAMRVFYHLQMLEAFMDVMGIEFERPFPLSVEAVQNAINGNLLMAMSANRILLDLEDVRPRLNFMPLQRGAVLEFASSNPLVTMERTADKGYQVYHGNTALTYLHPEYFEYDYSLDGLSLRIDGAERFVPFGSLVGVRDSFLVQSVADCRVNVIGYTHPEQENESGLTIRRKDFVPRFSVDNSERVYRVEAYLGDRFAGMILVRFGGATEVQVTGHELVPASEAAVRRKLIRTDKPTTALRQSPKSQDATLSR